MKPLSLRPGWRPLLILLTFLVLKADVESAEQSRQPKGDEFDTVGEAVVKLLQSHDAANFATNLGVAAEDWLSVVSSNLPAADAEKIKSFAKGSEYNRQRLESSAKAVVARADALNLDFSKGAWSSRVVVPNALQKMYLTSPSGNREDQATTISYLDKLQIILVRGAEAETSTNNAFGLIARGLQKFPTGWRISEGLQWTAFPKDVADARTLMELAIQQKIAARESLTGDDDPALLSFGETLVRFLRERDTTRVEKELLLTSEVVWNMYQKMGEKLGRSGPSRAEVDAEIGKQMQEQLAKVQAMLKLMEESGVDLKDADIQIKEASLKQCQAPLPDSLEGLSGRQFKLGLSVKTDKKAANGSSLSGEYVLAARQIMRMADGWKLGDNLHWEKLPDGVLDAKTASQLEFDRHVAERGTLPPQTVAPEIEFTTLVDEKKMKLSDFRGKVVILEFWATWCGPCQEPMAELQKICDEHPGWQDQVAIVPLSIDDTMEVVRKHVAQRGWTNTFNVWAGEGGWRAAPAKAFYVKGVPTSYLIDPQGKIVWAGHPAGASFGRRVDALLKK
ncbi:MAG TPA: TlpA disulfide reductase family protein [Verrucomicrobiae bacterium]|nr:TlpA disulfide reductase family protein [Verrucomicrobiae bacterium]